MSTIHSVAALAGVSSATVSRVMNDPHKVREATRMKVEAAMRTLDFSRNSFAASLASRRSDCVGLVVPHLSGAFFAPLVNAVEDAVSAVGSHLVITCGKNSVDEVAKGLQFLRQRRCDAIILYPGQLSDEALAEMLQQNPHMVVIHRTVPGFETRCVQLDNHTGGQLAAQYLLRCGHRDIGVIVGPRDNPESMQRLAAFRHTLAAAGQPLPSERVSEGDFHFTSGSACMAALWASQPTMSAVFCLNDQMAFGALNHCRAAGIAVPTQLSLMGFDDVEYADLIHPRLTTVHHPVAALARTAAQLALRLATGEVLTAPQRLLEPTLVVRDSVRVLPGA
ncbi:MAG: LacI family DNA-binding transcriptional regulator [Rhodoferax sp.]|uniref:LacI family DNA-binding transcriptional regulator n=1 Tax=Rhodoferax sp. TaxID=50421 RepID=UPI0032655394